MNMQKEMKIEEILGAEEKEMNDIGHQESERTLSGSAIVLGVRCSCGEDEGTSDWENEESEIIITMDKEGSGSIAMPEGLFQSFKNMIGEEENIEEKIISMFMGEIIRMHIDMIDQEMEEEMEEEWK